MKRKNIISLSVAFAFLALSITGILLYVKQKAHAVEITHTIFGLIFISFAVFHIINNWGSITGYSKERKSGKFQKEFIVAGLVFLAVLAGGVTKLLEPVAEAGKIFAPKKEPKAQQLSFEEVNTNTDAKGIALEILIEKSKDAELPIMAIWAEDIDGKFIENLFVPSEITKMPESEEEAREGKFEIVPFTGASLTNWISKAGDKKSNYPKATPKDNFVLKTKTKAQGKFTIVIETSCAGKTEMYSFLVDNNNNTTAYLLKTKPGSIVNRAVAMN